MAVLCLFLAAAGGSVFNNAVLNGTTIFTGNVGIGTEAPTAAHRLDVVGGHLKVGVTGVGARKGITLFDTVDGSAHCVTINTDALNAAAGACS